MSDAGQGVRRQRGMTNNFKRMFAESNSTAAHRVKARFPAITAFVDPRSTFTTHFLFQTLGVLGFS